MMADPLGKQVGDYRLIHFLGNGTFGDVYEGLHVHLETHVAVKLLKGSFTEVEIKKFLDEARILARLEHPNIVRIFTFSVAMFDELKLPFLAMSLAPNGTLLNRHPRGTSLQLPTIVMYVKQIASALQYAHNNKYIHRDVKPENILLGKNDELLLSDFGIAVVAHSAHSLETPNVGGTLPYMAPEQLEGKPQPASDQYALGIIVYEWLCGERPFNGTAAQIIRKHMLTPPPPLCGKVPMLSSGVEQVVMRALAKDPDKRFTSMQAFANALEQAQQSRQPFTVGSLTDPQSSSSSRSEHPMPISQAPPTEPMIAPSPLDTPLIYPGHSGGANAVAWSPAGKYIATGSDDGTVKVWDANTGATLTTYTRHTDMVFAVAWSPDGKRIVSSSRDATIQIWDASTGLTLITYTGLSQPAGAVAWSPDGSRIASHSSSYSETAVQVWDTITGTELLTYKGHTKQVTGVAWSPDGKRIASGGADNTVQIWDTQTGASIYTYHDKAPVHGVTWSPDGKRIASSSSRVQVWDAETGAVFVVQLYKEFEGFESINDISSYFGGPTREPSVDEICHMVAWSPDGKRIASFITDLRGSSRGAIELWDAKTGASLFTYKDHTAGVKALAWSPDSTRIVSVSFREILVWGTFVGNTLVTYRGHLGSARIKWSPDSKYIASVSNQDNTLQVWNTKTGEKCFASPFYFASSSEDRDPIVRLQWSPNGRFLVFSSDMTRGLFQHILDVETGAVRWSSAEWNAVWAAWEAAWSPDGRHIAIYKHNMLEAQDVATGATLRKYQFESLPFLYGMSWSPDGRRIAMRSSNSDRDFAGYVYVWDISAGFKFSRKPITLPIGKVVTIKWLPDSRHIAVGHWGDKGQVWDSIKGVRLANYEGVLSADNEYIAHFTKQEVQVRHVIIGAEIVTFRNHTADVQALAWSCDGRCIASYDASQIVRVWDVKTGAEIATYKNPTDNVGSLVWSPNGRYIAFSSKDYATYMSVWDMSQGTRIRTYRCPPGGGYPQWSPDSTHIALAGCGIYLWQVV